VEATQQSPDNWDTQQPSHTPHLSARPSKTSGKKRLLYIAGIVLIVVAVAAVAYMLLAGKKDEAPKKVSTSSGQHTDDQPAGSQVVDDTPKTYKSEKLGLEFIYRSDWKMRETTDKTEIILTSPQVTYQKKDGQSANGVFTLKIRNGLLPEAMKPTIQEAVAIKDSEVIGYTQPTEQQRHFTNMSFAGKDANNFSFMMVTGNAAFKAGDVFGSGVDTQGSFYLFAGGYGIDANDSLSFDAVPKTSFDTAVYQQAVEIIKSLKIY
jgi:hypothetical protein